MKYLSLLLLLFVFACTDDKPAGLESTASYVASPDQDTAKYVPLYIHDIPAEADLNASPVATGAYGQILLPDLNRYQAQLLVKSHWIVDGYADMNGSRFQRQFGIGQWYRFNTNGTFTAGHWDRQTHAGAYYLDFQRNNPRLTIDSNVDRMDAVYEIQAINGAQDQMGLVRVNDSGFGPQRSGISIRMTALTDRPTKQQYARELGL